MKVKQTPVQSQILKNPESRRSFTEAFKRQAVELMESGRAVAQLARELEVSAFSLYEWKRKYHRDRGTDAPHRDRDFIAMTRPTGRIVVN